MKKVIMSYALFSLCHKYRYLLWRYWDYSLPYVCFFMLNPSYADGIHDDPTIARCIKRAMKMKGIGGIVIVNLFAYISTDPKPLKHLKNPVGRYNDKYIKYAVTHAEKVIVAWGNVSKMPKPKVNATSKRGKRRDEEAVEWMQSEEISMHCLGRNKDKHLSPSHPGRLPDERVIVPY